MAKAHVLPLSFSLCLINMRLQNRHRQFMHGTVIRFSHSTYSLFLSLGQNFFCVLLLRLSLERTTPIFVPFRRQKKPFASLYNFSFLYIADPILLFFLFESCLSYSCSIARPILVRATYWGVYVIYCYFLSLSSSCFQSSFQRCSHFPFFFHSPLLHIFAQLISS